MLRLRSPAQLSEEFAAELLFDKEGGWWWAITVEVQKVRWRGSSSLFLLSLQKWPPSITRWCKVISDLFTVEWPCSSGNFLVLTYHLSGLLCLSSFALTFSYCCFRKALSELLAGSLKLMRYHQPFPFLSRAAEARGSWALECVWEVFVLTAWWLHTSLRESRMSLVCNGIIFLLLQRVFCVNLPGMSGNFQNRS